MTSSLKGLHCLSLILVALPPKLVRDLTTSDTPSRNPLEGFRVSRGLGSLLGRLHVASLYDYALLDEHVMEDLVQSVFLLLNTKIG